MRLLGDHGNAPQVCANQVSLPVWRQLCDVSQATL